jgi:MtN3 and saliva related transmembrane protein
MQAPVHARTMTELTGWVSSAVLLLTIGRQVYTQWRARTTAGVSRWLFVGQLTASTGFALYSWLLHNWVFLSSNLLLLVTAVLGQMIYLSNRRRDERRAAAQRMGAP